MYIPNHELLRILLHLNGEKLILLTAIDVVLEKLHICGLSSISFFSSIHHLTMILDKQSPTERIERESTY